MVNLSDTDTDRYIIHKICPEFDVEYKNTKMYRVSHLKSSSQAAIDIYF